MADRRFYRPPPPLSNLGRVVWDAKRDCMLAEFGRDTNQFTTTKKEVADELVRLGYTEISVELKTPPYIPEQPVVEVGDIKINPAGFTEEHAVAKAKREKALETPPVPKKKVTVKPKVVKKPEAVKKPVRNALKKRVKK